MDEVGVGTLDGHPYPHFPMEWIVFTNLDYKAIAVFLAGTLVGCGFNMFVEKILGF